MNLHLDSNGNSRLPTLGSDPSEQRRSYLAVCTGLEAVNCLAADRSPEELCTSDTAGRQGPKKAGSKTVENICERNSAIFEAARLFDRDSALLGVVSFNARLS